MELRYLSSCQIYKTFVILSQRLLISGAICEKKILIVDDEEEILAFMARFLKRLEIDSVTAVSGEDAIALYKKNNFDCVLLDIHLGGMNGVEVLKA